MSKKIFFSFFLVLIFFQISFAQVCAKLIDARCGETHTLALMEDGSLYSCGTDLGGQLGLGSDVTESVLSLKQVKGEGGIGFLKNIKR